MRGIVMFAEQFFWTMIWIFLILIVGFFLLRYASGVGGPIGSVADWVSSHADPQG